MNMLLKRMLLRTKSRQKVVNNEKKESTSAKFENTQKEQEKLTPCDRT